MSLTSAEKAVIKDVTEAAEQEIAQVDRLIERYRIDLRMAKGDGDRQRLRAQIKSAAARRDEIARVALAKLADIARRPIPIH